MHFSVTLQDDPVEDPATVEGGEARQQAVPQRRRARARRRLADPPSTASQQLLGVHRELLSAVQGLNNRFDALEPGLGRIADSIADMAVGISSIAAILRRMAPE